jgi:hypothetical protein
MTTNIYDILLHDNKYQPDNDVETLGLKQLALSDMPEASVPAATSETYRLGIDKDQKYLLYRLHELQSLHFYH